MTRNVVLIVLDTVRKDTFDRYAKRLREASGTSFEQCRAASSWSVPSHTSMFTGTLPHEHGIHAERFDAGFSFQNLPRSETFLTDLPDHRAVGLSANAYINTLFEFDHLFAEFHDFSIGSHTNESLFPDGLTVQNYMKTTDEDHAVRRYLGFLRACAGHDHPAKSLANGVWSQIGHRYKRLPLPEFVDDGASAITRTGCKSLTSGEEPVFTFVNVMDAHTPLRNLTQYDRSLHSVPNTWSSNELNKWELNREGAATDAYTSNYRELYGAAIDYLDRRVTEFVEAVQAGTDHETTFIITADHGHNLGYPAENGLFHHTGSMSEGLLHVPLEILNPPEGFPEREDRYISHLELGELVRRLAHEEPFDDALVRERIPAETVGLLGEGDGTWGLDFGEAEYARWNRMIRVVYKGTTKYEWDSLGNCVEWALDPDRPCWQERIAEGDAVDLLAFAEGSFDVAIETYKRQVTKREQDMDFDDDVKSQLKRLGYL